MPWKYQEQFFLNCCKILKYLTDLKIGIKCPCKLKDTSIRDLKGLFQFIAKFRLKNVMEISRTCLFSIVAKNNKGTFHLDCDFACVV